MEIHMRLVSDKGSNRHLKRPDEFAVFDLKVWQMIFKDREVLAATKYFIQWLEH